MPLRPERGRCTGSRRCAWTVAIVLSIGVLPVPMSASAQPESGSVGRRPDAAAVKQALEIVRADPNLGARRTARRLRFRGTFADGATPQIPAWLQQLAIWLAESTRYIVWLIAVVAAALLAAYLVRIARAGSRSGDDGLALTPSYVRDLDIRPESLPRDVGAAARELWERGEPRAALSLLYRGMLSRLVHVHRVPVRASSTEGDCLRLSNGTLATDQREYVASLIRVWQQLVYGHQPPDADRVFALCAEFDPRLAARATSRLDRGAVA
ncbi:MAG TPA: DUF4129 domain-containing protein [Vicinamibacterales bacterium]|nr:DUF4129 domain-containing protein [Vicinamibacterales bacterium]